MQYALVLDKHDAPPKQVNVPVIAGDFPYRLFKARYGPAAHTEHVEEFVPEGLPFGLFPSYTCPLFGEGNRTVANLVPGNWHRRIIPKRPAAAAIFVPGAPEKPQTPTLSLRDRDYRGSVGGGRASPGLTVWANIPCPCGAFERGFGTSDLLAAQGRIYVKRTHNFFGIC